MASAVVTSCSTSAYSTHHFTSKRSPLLPKLTVVAAAKSNPSSKKSPPIHHRLIRSLAVSRHSSAALAAALMAAASPLPALAEQMEKAALFDFNLTLPAIVAEFLLLMVALDKIYFTPLGKFMDERDAAIRAQLGDVKDTSSEVKQMEDQAAAVMKAARAEISAALNKMKKETTAELEVKLAEGRKRVEAELAEALENLEKQKEETIRALDSQIAALSDEIVKKVLPAASK
ncbi:ATP synthase subunit b', chloroplastic [Typha angustifolia]|uniref:ATP synthase subunit b', chloroplastic n=1 Tax=Typha angustifolia TaxID=59011 RepID=UPI003C2EDE1A